MKALILAGGLGTRMRPLTYTRPKHLLPIANRPHIEHVFDLLQRQSITEVVFTTSYMAEAFTGAIEAARARGITVAVTHEEEPLGTAGAMRNALPEVDDGPFLAFNGDVLTDVDLAGLIAFHQAKGARATILLTPVDDPSAFGVVPTDSDGRVERFIEKPPREEAPTDLINAGVYVLEPDVLKLVPEGVPSSIERELFPELVTEGSVYAMPTDAYWMDIGTPQKFLQANLDALRGSFKTDATEGVVDGVLAAPDARIEQGARVSWSCLAGGTLVGEGSTVEDSVLLARVVVEPGAKVAGSVLGEGVTVRAGADVTHETIGDGEEIGGR